MTDGAEAKRYGIFEVSDPQVPKINPALAAEIGLNESLILTQIAFFLRKSKHLHDGQYWIYKTFAEMQKEWFPFLSIGALHRAIESLSERHLIVRSKAYNDRKNDTTVWYSIDIEGLSRLESIIVMELNAEQSQGEFQNGKPVFQNGTTLPDITTEQDKYSVPPVELAASAPPAKPRKTPSRSEQFKLIAAKSFGLSDTDTLDGETVTRINMLAKWLKDNAPDITPAMLKEFYDWYDRTVGVNRPRAVSAFATHVQQWRQSATGLTGNVVYDLDGNAYTGAAASVFAGLRILN